MAKARKSAGNKTNPALAAALICEKVLVEKDEVVSAIRAVDHVTVPAGVRTPKKGDSLVFGLTILLSFKAGDTSGGERKMELYLVSPSGKKARALQTDLHFASGKPEAGYNVRGDLVLKYEKEGLYWYEVYVEGEFITKMPLRISIARPEAKSDGAAE